MDWQDVEKKLVERAEEVCRHLLPNGRREGAEWVCGDVDGHKGRSLKVNLEGKAGVWADFAGDGRGKTLMSLWCSVRSRPFRECIVEAKRFVGIVDEGRRLRSPSAVNGAPAEKPEDSSWRAVSEVWGRCQELTEGGPVWNYLTGRRKIEGQVLRWYGVREMISHGAWAMVFPYWPTSVLSASGEQDLAREVAGLGRVPLWLKFELLDRPGGKKREWTTRSPEKCLWAPSVEVCERLERSHELRHVLICEGEKDAMSWASYGALGWGLLPVSVPFGAKWRAGTGEKFQGLPSPNREWLDRCWEWLQGFETIFVAMDSDEAGRRAAADIIAEVGPRRCRLVELPERMITAKNAENTKEGR